MNVLPKIGKFITGVCHPGQRLDLIREAGMDWVRIDVPFPYPKGQWGQWGEPYLQFRQKCRDYGAKGLRVMCVSPFPRDFARVGIDPASREGLEKVRAVCGALAEDLSPCNVGWQITNELNVFHFRQPLTLAEAPAFIAAGLEGVAAAAPAALCGYNTAGTGDEAEALVRRVQSAYPRSDYIGLDTYRGTWQDGEPEDILADIRAVHSWTGLPVLLQEVGFASAGETFQMEEAFRYLRGMGFESVEALRADPEMFLRRIPYQIAQSVFQSPREEWADNALTMVPHLLKRWPGGSKVYRHTPQGQAAFYRALLGQLTDLPCICGAILYCWSDSELCYSCKCGDCPCETAWGLTDTQENPKPVYAVVKEFWGNPSEGCAKP